MTAVSFMTIYSNVSYYALPPQQLMYDEP